ncbi:MAG: UbiD family decarboxylase [Chloroflexi bacterium]|nr:UbiD family decarboxylase [Chloroflexota bacterium]
MVRDLRDWLKEVEKIGELLRISEEVDWDQEMSGIAYMLGKQIGSPALLFENIKGYPRDRRVLLSMLGSSMDRIALAMRMPIGKTAKELIQFTRERVGKRIPPQVVDARSAPVNENVLFGDDIDITQFPVPKFWPLDGGRYIGTADVIITKDPDHGWLNLGTYRQMVMSKNEVGFYVSPGKDALIHREGWWKRGKPCEVAAVYGVDPLLYACGSLQAPKNVSEYEYAGGLQGEPIEVIKGEVTDLLIPARAEIVIEGLAYPGRVANEGPFGEFTGYYGNPGGPQPVIEVKCVHFRNNPILTGVLMSDYPSCEEGWFYSISKSARVHCDLEGMGMPGIKSVYAYPAAASAFGVLVVSIEQKYAGHASQVLSLAAQCPGAGYYTKWIIVVDEDVDPSNINEVLWAMSTRCKPVEDIDILRNTWSTYLDPSQNPPEKRPYGSKVLINACKEHRYLKVFSRRMKMKEEVYNRIKARWQKLGLPGEPSEIKDFETE